MEPDLWWLLLFPIFFGLGWFAARVDMRTVLKQARTVPQDFFRSLEALIDDKTDVAAQVLAEIVRQQPMMPELEYTLGKLYRKRGENDRAIRLHQRLLEAPDLRAEYKDTILFELAEDFRKAGLVDRAEELLLTLLEGNMALAARRQLLGIYQQDRDWQKAIDTAQALRSDAHSFQHEVAQFYCELAQGELYKSSIAQARNYVNQSLQSNRKCVRASLILGDIEMAQGQIDLAIAAWQGIEKQNYKYLPMAAERLFEAYEAQGKPHEALALLKGYQSTFAQLDFMDLLYEKIALYEGEEKAIEMARETLHLRPTLVGADRLVGAQMKQMTIQNRIDAEVIHALLQKHAQRLTVHKCKCCNFRSRAFFWHCPACGEWESFTPNRLEI